MDSDQELPICLGALGKVQGEKKKKRKEDLQRWLCIGITPLGSGTWEVLGTAGSQGGTRARLEHPDSKL